MVLFKNCNIFRRELTVRGSAGQEGTKRTPPPPESHSSPDPAREGADTYCVQ